MKNQLLMMGVSGLLCCFSAAAQESGCQGFQRDVPIETGSADAGMIANLRSADGSVKAESKRVIRSAAAGLALAAPPSDLCPAPCQISGRPLIVFDVTPSKYLEQYSESTVCAEQLEKTKTAPYAFSPPPFASPEAITDWFSEFSLGRGPDGKELYRLCSGDCSPQYLSLIEFDGKLFKVSERITCGHARDKSDNRYVLKTAYRWTCKPPANSPSGK